MAAQPHPYQRLTRNHTGAGAYHSLWLGPDHLLLVTVIGFSEEYRRFFFRDIQVICLERTRLRLWWGIFWGGLAALVSLLVLLGSDSLLVTLLVGILVFQPFAWNLVLGPGCRAHVVTAVQLTHLPSLARLRKARRVVARLQPLIRAAQADLAAPPPFPETQAAQPSAHAAPTPTSVPPAAPAPQAETQPAPATAPPPAA